MIGYIANFGITSRSANLTFAVLTISVTLLAASSANAQNAWSVNISEKEMKLEHPVDMMWDKWLMWDIGYQRMMCRNSPYIELHNEATSTSPISKFHLTIGDSNFSFAPVQGSNYAQLGSSTPGFSLTSSTLNNQGDELIVTIGNGGLLPGQFVRFQINLNVDPAYAAQYAASFGGSQPDFRTVLFDMNGLNVYTGVQKTSSEDNAQASVVFVPGGKSIAVAFPDEIVPAGQYYNNNLRAYRASDPVLIFQIAGGAEVPEPSTVALAMLVVSATACVRRSR